MTRAKDMSLEERKARTETILSMATEPAVTILRAWLAQSDEELAYRELIENARWTWWAYNVYPDGSVSGRVARILDRSGTLGHVQDWRIDPDGRVIRGTRWLRETAAASLAKRETTPA